MGSGGGGLSHGCGGRVEEEEGGAAGVCGCRGVGFGGVAGAVPPGPGPGPGVWGWNGAGTGKGSGASGGSARSGRMACGSGIRGGGGASEPGALVGFGGFACAVRLCGCA